MTKKDKKHIFDKLASSLAVSNDELNQFEDGQFPHWSTGCVVADILTGIGGLPQGRIVEVFGKYSSGKSNLLISTAAQVQKQGKKVIFLDYERTFSPAWARKLGLDVTDPETFLLIRADETRTVEDGFDIITSFLNSDSADNIGLIIWDSLAGSVSEAEANKDSAGDTARIASRASILNNELPKLAQLIEAKKLSTTVAFVNQLRANLNPMARGDNTPGGLAFKHWASMRIQISEIKRITKTTVDEFTLSKKLEPIAQRIKISIEKTKHGQRGRTAEVVFTFQNGFDNAGILVEYACLRGDFEKISAQKFRVPGEFTHDGQPLEGTEATIRKYYYTNEVAADILTKEMSVRINSSYWEKVKSFSFKDFDSDMVPEAVTEEEQTNIIDLEEADADD